MKYAEDKPIVPSFRISKNKPLKKASTKTSFFRIVIAAKIIISKLKGRVMSVDSSKIEIARNKEINFIFQ